MGFCFLASDMNNGAEIKDNRLSSKVSTQFILIVNTVALSGSFS